jgi:hypothetical protein
MKDYLFLFRGGDMSKLSPEEVQKHNQKWVDWVNNLSKAGKFKGGEPLEKEGKVVNGSKKIVTDGPFAESKEVVGGYLIVLAKDLKEATEIAKDCPTHEINGSTEIREIAHMM